MERKFSLWQSLCHPRRHLLHLNSKPESPPYVTWVWLIIIAIVGSCIYGASLSLVMQGWNAINGALWLALSAGLGWLITYQTPAACARQHLPHALDLVTRGDIAFWNVVVCHIHSIRPKPFPTFTGLAYWHVAYRLYAKFRRRNGEVVEGLYFLRSDCDNGLITKMGNMMTDFNFHTARIEVKENDENIEYRIKSSDSPAHAILNKNVTPQLKTHSVFNDLNEAATFLKYKPRGISVGANNELNVVEIIRDEAAWKSRLLHVEEYEWAFLRNQNVRPEICYKVMPIAYQWNRGVCV